MSNMTMPEPRAQVNQPSIDFKDPKWWVFGFGVLSGALACLMVYSGVDAVKAGFHAAATASAGGACGFGIGGGLCFLAFAVMHTRG
jgi:hypothetical protein